MPSVTPLGRRLKEHRNLSARPTWTLSRRIGVESAIGAERNLPPLAQAMDVTDGQRVFGGVESAASRVESEDRPTRRAGGQKRRGKKAGDGGQCQE
jgi:hypothetical protein